MDVGECDFFLAECGWVWVSVIFFTECGWVWVSVTFSGRMWLGVDECTIYNYLFSNFCSANQWTRFYMTTASVMKGLKQQKLENQNLKIVLFSKLFR